MSEPEESAKAERDAILRRAEVAEADWQAAEVRNTELTAALERVAKCQDCGRCAAIARTALGGDTTTGADE